MVAERDASFCPQCGARLPAERQEAVTSGTELDLGFGRAVVGDVLGQGGMGVVRHGWLFYDPAGPRAGTPEHPVAIKLLHPLLRGRERAQQLFLREAEALSRLDHPSVVRFYGLGRAGPHLGIVMEWVAGEALSAVLARHAEHPPPTLEPRRAWHYFSQLLGALAAVHALGIVHRDVKPGNVLVGTDGVVKITDFGIARLPADEVLQTGGMAPGTGAYMAPEQIMAKAMDGRTDLYSAAIVLYEMFAGRTPFEGKNRSEMMIRAAQLDESPAPLSSLVPMLAALDLPLARALAKEPELRWSRAVELGDAVRSALGITDDAWNAQREFAAHAREVSQKMPAHQSRDGALRTAVLSAYRR